MGMEHSCHGVVKTLSVYW